MRVKKQMRPLIHNDGLHAAVLRTRQQPGAPSRPDLALPEPSNAQHERLERDAHGDDVPIAIDQRLEVDARARTAVLSGDCDALRKALDEGVSPYGVVECLHLCSTQGNGVMPPDAARRVVDMARLLVPNLSPNGIYSCADKNPWFVTYNCPELLDLYAEADVPKPTSGSGGDVDLACFYIHNDAAENLRRYLTLTNRVEAPCVDGSGNTCGGTLLHSAARIGAPGCVAMLLGDYGLDVNRDANGVTALDEVLSSRASWTPERLEVVKLLVGAGADLQRRLGGKLPYQRVQGRPPQEVLETLGFTTVRG
jgi:hypothetical protein